MVVNSGQSLKRNIPGSSMGLGSEKVKFAQVVVDSGNTVNHLSESHYWLLPQSSLVSYPNSDSYISGISQ